MAKKQQKKTPKQFAAEVATNPEKLGNFILDPEGVFAGEKFTKAERDQIKQALSHFTTKKLSDALHVTSFFH